MFKQKYISQPSVSLEYRKNGELTLSDLSSALFLFSCPSPLFSLLDYLVIRMLTLFFCLILIFLGEYRLVAMMGLLFVIWLITPSGDKKKLS